MWWHAPDIAWPLRKDDPMPLNEWLKGETKKSCLAAARFSCWSTGYEPKLGSLLTWSCLQGESHQCSAVQLLLWMLLWRQDALMIWCSGCSTKQLGLETMGMGKKRQNPKPIEVGGDAWCSRTCGPTVVFLSRGTSNVNGWAKRCWKPRSKTKGRKKHLVSKELWCLSSSLETHQMRGLGQPPNSAGDCEWT